MPTKTKSDTAQLIEQFDIISNDKQEDMENIKNINELIFGG